MSLLFNDTFTDTTGTNLTAHTPDSGGSWSLPGTGSFVISDANRARLSAAATGSNPAYYLASVTPASADYDVSADFFLESAAANLSINGRFSSGANNSDNNGYRAFYSGGSGGILLQKIVSGTVTTLGSSSTSISVGTSKTFMLRMRGTTISVLVNGVSLISLTNTVFSAAGQAGLSSDTASANATGVHADNFQINDTVTGIFIPNYLTGGFKTLNGGIRG